MTLEVLQNPSLFQPNQRETLVKLIENHGYIGPVASIMSGLVGTAFIGVFIRRRGISIHHYLNLKRTPLWSFLSWNILMYLFLIFAGSLARYLSQKSDYLERTLNAVASVPLLYLAVVVVAPLFEEILFRGFLFKGLEASKLGPWGTIFFTSLIWAIIHLQYSLFFMGIIFVLGILLGVARYKSQSLWVPLSMHALNNLLAMLAVDLPPSHWSLF